LLRRALKHAALAVALVVPTLAGVVAQAPAAHATTTPIANSPFRGGAQVNASYGDTTISVAAWTVPTSTSTCSVSDAFTQADRSTWLTTPGGTIYYCFDWSSHATDGVEDFHWYDARLTVRHMNQTDTSTDVIKVEEGNDGTDYGNFDSVIGPAGIALNLDPPSDRGGRASLRG